VTPLTTTIIVLVDLVVTTLVAMIIIRRRGGLKAWLGVDLAAMRAFATEAEQTIVDFMRANWSGDASTLPAAMDGLLTQLEPMAAARGLKVPRAVLQQVAGRVIVARGLATSGDMTEALRKAA